MVLNDENLNKITFVVSEVDGIITEGLTGIGELGIPLFKEYYTKDFEAINLLKKDFGFAFISKDAYINMSFCKKKQIPFFFAENKKEDVYNKLLRRYSLTPDNILYIGTSFSDVNCMCASGVSFCPEDSVDEVKKVSDHVIPLYGGTGVLCYTYEMLKEVLINKNRG